MCDGPSQLFCCGSFSCGSLGCCGSLVATNAAALCGSLAISLLVLGCVDLLDLALLKTLCHSCTYSLKHDVDAL